MTRGNLQRARELLLQDLGNLRISQGWRIEVVFDGRKRPEGGLLTPNQPKARMKGENRANDPSVIRGVRVVFTGIGVEADTYIQERCNEAKNVTSGTLTGDFIVATDDNAIRLAAVDAGAVCMGAGRFVDELRAQRRIVTERVQQFNDKMNQQAFTALTTTPVPQNETAPMEAPPDVKLHKNQFIETDRKGNSMVVNVLRNRTSTKKRKKRRYVDMSLDPDDLGW